MNQGVGLRTPATGLFGSIFLGLAVTRLCHIHILWDDEAYPLAGAIQMLAGKAPYRDVWFDKPPFAPAIYLLWGARAGWPLRLGGALLGLLACWLIYRFARELWSEREGLAAAGLLGFFLTFDMPSAVIAIASDFLLMLPHMAAVYLAWRRRAFWSGVAAGVALGFSSKGFFVLAAVLIWLLWNANIRVLARAVSGFLVPNLALLALLAARGALPDYYQQVWKWGFLYAGSTFIANPALNGMERTAHWLGFHLALVIGAAWFWWRGGQDKPRWQTAAWAAISFAGTAAGWRFFPRYFFLLLPVLTLAAARGFVLLGKKRGVVLVALLIPMIRFGPRYVVLAEDLAVGRPQDWRDLGMQRESRNAAAIVNEMAKPGDSLFVWGYRPDLYAYTRLPAGSRFMDSQPLTGVPSDRHLTQSVSIEPEWAARNRQELAGSHPTFLVDGISMLNPELALGKYGDLAAWFAEYRFVGQTPTIRIYRRASGK